MEDLVKKYKKFGTAQIISQLGMLKDEERRNACIEVLKSRGKDVSQFENASLNLDEMEEEPETVEPLSEDVDPEEQPSPVTEPMPEEPKTKGVIERRAMERAVLEDQLEEFIDKLVEENRHGVYGEVLRVLNGNEDSEITDLISGATLVQLKEALSFKGLDVVEPEKKSKKKSKEKITVPKPSAGVSISEENPEVKIGIVVSFDRDGVKIVGKVASIFYSHKNGKEICRVDHAEGDKTSTFKRTNKLTVENESL